MNLQKYAKKISKTDAMREVTKDIIREITFIGTDRWRRILAQRVRGLQRTHNYTSEEIIGIAFPVLERYKNMF